MLWVPARKTCAAACLGHRPRPVLERLGKVVHLDLLLAGQVRDRAAQIEQPG